MKSIQHFLEILPEPARTKAFNNVDKSVDLTQLVESTAEAIGRSFAECDYDNTLEGFKYWYPIITAADTEYQHVLAVNTMCLDSLDQATLAKWSEVKVMLEQNRKQL